MAKKTAPKSKKSVAKPALKTKAKAAPLKAKPAVKKAAPVKAAKADKKLDAKKVSGKPVKQTAQKDVKLSAGKKAGVVMSSKSGAAALKVEAPVALKGKKGAVAPLSGKAVKRAVSEASSDRKKAYDADVCREIACEGLSTTSGYCRLHYIKNWKKIKRKELILKEKKLNQYIEELVAKYPDKYIEAIRSDLADEKAFSKVIYDLELDEGIDEIPSEEESDDSIIESVKRDFDDTDTDF